jgi:hypothetical protein
MATDLSANGSVAVKIIGFEALTRSSIQRRFKQISLGVKLSFPPALLSFYNQFFYFFNPGLNVFTILKDFFCKFPVFYAHHIMYLTIH